MAKKAIVHFICSECGANHSKWAGQCECGAWNTIKEFKESASRAGAVSAMARGYSGSKASVSKLSDIKPEDSPRFSTNNVEFDRVLGGGIVPGSVILLAGTPGAGKSTLTTQVLCEVSDKFNCFLVSAEESANQISRRAIRLKLKTEHLNVIDSLQAMFHPDVQGAPGGVGQLRECMQVLTQHAKQNDVAMIIVCHTTKDGSVAGPRVVEHIGDVMLMIEVIAGSRFREIRAAKNRFGSTSELGLLAMMPDNGYLKAVTNPSAIFLDRSRDPKPGSMVASLWEGSRSLLVEIQALVIDSHQGNPRRLAVGIDQNRLNMLVAVLVRHADLAMYDQELYVNLVGGLRSTDPSTDLPVVLAMVSSFKDRAIPHNWVAFGELGLSGDVRSVPSGLERIKQAAQQGFAHCICPKGNVPKNISSNIKVYPVETLTEAIDRLEEIM
jgi:DNA repair protein RadA/Sms